MGYIILVTWKRDGTQHFHIYDEKERAVEVKSNWDNDKTCEVRTEIWKLEKA